MELLHNHKYMYSVTQNDLPQSMLEKKHFKFSMQRESGT